MGIKKRLKKLQQKSREINREIWQRSIGYIVAAFGFVVALAWNDFIKSAIDRFFPLPNEGLRAKLIYAALVTVVLVVLSVYAIKFFEDDKEKKKK